jgi:hypothetical protein
VVAYDTAMEPSKELADQIYRERILRARRMPPDEKLAEGPRLFEAACSIMASGIRNQFPGLDDDQVAEILKERLDRLRRIEERGLYRPVTEEAP